MVLHCRSIMVPRMILILMHSRIACTGTLAIVLLSLFADSTHASARVPDRASPRWIVSYLTATPDSNLTIPEEFGPSDPAEQRRWQWRLYDPLTRRDTLFLALTSFPLFTRWDSTYATLEFMQGKKIIHMPWRVGGR